MNIKKQIKNHWVEPNKPDVSIIKSDLEFKEKKHHTISLPIYFASLAVVVLVFSLALVLTNYKFKFNKTIPQESQYSEVFGTLSYNNPKFDSNIKCSATTKGESINSESFKIWFNVLDIKPSDEELPENILDEISNAYKIDVIYGNDLYRIYFTQNNLIYIEHGEYICCYNLINAQSKYESFVKN